MKKAFVQCDKIKCSQNKSGFCMMEILYLDEVGKCYKKEHQRGAIK